MAIFPIWLLFNWLLYYILQKCMFKCNFSALNDLHSLSWLEKFEQLEFCSWSKSAIATLLDSLDPIFPMLWPKLNFISCHNSWAMLRHPNDWAPTYTGTVIYENMSVYFFVSCKNANYSIVNNGYFQPNLAENWKTLECQVEFE